MTRWFLIMNFSYLYYVFFSISGCFFLFFHLPAIYLEIEVLLRNQVGESSKKGIQAAQSTPIHDDK